MDKNDFLIYNELVRELYSCKKPDDLRLAFLEPLCMLVPFAYCSLFFANPKPLQDSGSDADLLRKHPLCIPQSFQAAEMKYLDHIHEDRTLWLLKSTESVLIRESSLFPEEDRLSAPLYIHCYQRYGVYDIMQYSIIHQEQFLGVLSLFRTKSDGEFTTDDMFYLRSLGVHLNAVTHRLLMAESSQHASASIDVLHLKKEYGLTDQEAKVLELTFQFLQPEEIEERLSIKSNTLQKHMQNLYRKFKVASKWELLRWR